MGRTATLLAGIPSENPSLFHRVRFSVGDPAAWLAIEDDGQQQTRFIVRDIEMQRAREAETAQEVFCPADFTPPTGLSGDRMTATAQAVAECLNRAGVDRVVTDRTLPYIFAWHIQQLRIPVEYSPELGVLDRRVKDEQELTWLTKAQAVTEDTVLMACQVIAQASSSSDGVLQHEGAPLTSQRMQKMISTYLLDRDYANPHGSIVATTPDTADCHQRGSGELRTGEAVIIDVFPRSNTSGYHGDCTRTVVHGDASDTMVRMHAAVVAAKADATAASSAGASADDVHSATKAQLKQHGFPFVRGKISDEPIMPHGTGHGIGLEVHEPILLDDNGGDLLAGEVLTIEPGLYSRQHGGVRVEDMVVITDGAPRNLNRLPEGLDWR